MKKLSRRALQIYTEAHNKILEAVVNQKRKRGNTQIISTIIGHCLELEIHNLMGVSDEHIQSTLEECYRLRELISDDENEEFSAEFSYSTIDLFITSLEAKIPPNSCLFIGSDADQEEELKRINKLLEERDLIEEVSENE